MLRVRIRVRVSGRVKIKVRVSRLAAAFYPTAGTQIWSAGPHFTRCLWRIPTP